MPDEHVAAVLPKVNMVVLAMIQVQELAGMRPQDIRNMRSGDIDMSGDVWVYAPWTHKMEHRGLSRRIAIGPRAQSILRSAYHLGYWLIEMKSRAERHWFSHIRDTRPDLFDHLLGEIRAAIEDLGRLIQRDDEERLWRQGLPRLGN